MRQVTATSPVPRRHWHCFFHDHITMGTSIDRIFTTAQHGARNWFAKLAGTPGLNHNLVPMVKGHGWKNSICSGNALSLSNFICPVIIGLPFVHPIFNCFQAFCSSGQILTGRTTRFTFSGHLTMVLSSPLKPRAPTEKLILARKPWRHWRNGNLPAHPGSLNLFFPQPAAPQWTTITWSTGIFGQH